MPSWTNPIQPHTEEHLKRMLYHHLSIKEQAHMLNRSFMKANPTSYGFGESRFVSQERLMEIVHDMFHQDVDEKRPDLGFRPISSFQCDFLIAVTHIRS
jgi:hypothetical protein